MNVLRKMVLSTSLHKYSQFNGFVVSQHVELFLFLTLQRYLRVTIVCRSRFKETLNLDFLSMLMGHFKDIHTVGMLKQRISLHTIFLI